MTGISAGKFPTILYIDEPWETKSAPTTYDACSTLADSEDGDVIAVYELKYIGKIKHKTKMQMVNEAGIVLLEVDKE